MTSIIVRLYSSHGPRQAWDGGMRCDGRLREKTRKVSIKFQLGRNFINLTNQIVCGPMTAKKSHHTAAQSRALSLRLRPLKIKELYDHD